MCIRDRLPQGRHLHNLAGARVSGHYPAESAKQVLTGILVVMASANCNAWSRLLGLRGHSPRKLRGTLARTRGSTARRRRPSRRDSSPGQSALARKAFAQPRGSPCPGSKPCRIGKADAGNKSIQSNLPQHD